MNVRDRAVKLGEDAAKLHQDDMNSDRRVLKVKLGPGNQQPGGMNL